MPPPPSSSPPLCGWSPLWVSRPWGLRPKLETNPPPIPLSFSSSSSSFASPNHLVVEQASSAVPWGQVRGGKGNGGESSPPVDKGGGKTRAGLRAAGNENRRLRGGTGKKKKKSTADLEGTGKDLLHDGRIWLWEKDGERESGDENGSSHRGTGRIAWVGEGY